MTKKEHHECCEHEHHKHCEHMQPHMGMDCHDPLFMHGAKLAHAYVPIQCYNRQYSLPVALERGTLFPELHQPYMPAEHQH